jgi:hypothetical protein
MTDEELRKAIQKELRDEECRKIRLEMLREKARMDRKERQLEEMRCITPSLEARMEYLEADASAQRTAILRLECDNRWHRVGIWVLAAYLTGLALVVLT